MRVASAAALSRRAIRPEAISGGRTISSSSLPRNQSRSSTGSIEDLASDRSHLQNLLNAGQREGQRSPEAASGDAVSSTGTSGRYGAAVAMGGPAPRAPSSSASAAVFGSSGSSLSPDRNAWHEIATEGVDVPVDMPGAKPNPLRHVIDVSGIEVVRAVTVCFVVMYFMQ